MLSKLEKDNKEAVHRDKLRSNKLGNFYRFNEVARRSQALKRKINELQSDPDGVILNDESIRDKIENMQNCCPKGGRYGCILKHFTVNGYIELSNAVAFVKDLRCLSARKVGEARNRFIMSQFKTCVDSIDARGYLVVNYKVPPVKSARTTPHLCKKAYCAAMGFTKYEVDMCSQHYKLDKYAETFTKPIKYSDDHIHDFTYAEAKRIFEENVMEDAMIVDMDEENEKIGLADRTWITAALCPLSERQNIAIAWLERFFEWYGDFNPTHDRTGVSVQFKFDVYDKYERQFCDTPQYLISKERLLELWRVLFPHCVKREGCNIVGKCDICYEIESGRKDNGEAVMQEAFSKVHLMHRGGMFMLERNEYMKRIYRAVSQDRNMQTIQSFVIDGMDQSHCRVPYNGTQKEFSKPLTQHFTGVKEHTPAGGKVTIYRTLDFVPSKSPNMSIHCILDRIQNFKRRHNRLPEEVYVQLDGGSEFANETLLGLLELLVAKRIIRLIYYTRLPVGHTHSDIDAIFGVIWRKIYNSPCDTLSGYKRKVTLAFNAEGMSPELIDVYLLPDYVSVIGECIDKDLSRLHKELHTKHQWRFEAVDVSEYFPFGCKSTYRAYCSNRVIEFVKKPTNQCVAPVGRLTGLEPITTYCTWEPEAIGFNSIPGREGVEGFYILKSLPHFAPDISHLPYMPMPDNCIAEIQQTLSAIRAHFTDTTTHKRNIREEWENFFRHLAPDSMDVIRYREKLIDNPEVNLNEPLRDIVFNRNRYNHSHAWKLNNHSAVIDAEFKWPDTIIAAATHSVSSQFPSHFAPRIYTTTNQEILQRLSYYGEQCNPYLSHLSSRSYSIIRLQELLRRFVCYDGLQPTISGNKPAIVNQIKLKIEDAALVVLQNLADENRAFVDLMLNSPIDLHRSLDDIVSNIGDVPVQRKVLRLLTLGSRAQRKSLRELNSVIFTMFKMRDQRIVEAHTDVNSRTQHYKPYKPSLFLSDIETGQILADPKHSSLSTIFNAAVKPAVAYHKIYSVLVDVRANRLYVIIVDPEECTCDYVCSSSEGLISPVLAQYAHMQFCEFLNIQLNPIKRYMFCNMCDIHAEAGCNELVHVALILYYLVNNCPVIYGVDDVVRFRSVLCYWILSGRIPDLR